jgi:trk system potassium uptake protein TrkH
VTEIWTEDVLAARRLPRRRLHGRLDDDDDRLLVADYNTWPTLAMMTIVGLMFVGGSAGSTTGSVKVVRHLLLGKILRREIDQTLHPELVLPVRLNRASSTSGRCAASRRSSSSTSGSSSSAPPCSRSTRRDRDRAVAVRRGLVSASMLANVGPAFGVGGPLGSFEPFSDFSTC